MSAPSSSLLLLLTFAASLPARLGAAWSAFTRFDEGAGQSQTAPLDMPQPSAAPPAEESSPEVTTEASPQSEHDRQLAEAMASGLSEVEARVLIANINEQNEWLEAVQTQQWRRACWHAQLASICDAARRGVVISSIVSEGPAPQNFEVARHAIEVFEHNIRKAGLAHRQGDQQAPEPSAWS